MQRCNLMTPSSDWQEVINEGSKKWKTKSMLGVFCRLILSSIVYGIWRARNEVKYNGQPRTEEQILKTIS
jgi:hypothetical protein